MRRNSIERHSLRYSRFSYAKNSEGWMEYGKNRRPLPDASFSSRDLNSVCSIRLSWHTHSPTLYYLPSWRFGRYTNPRMPSPIPTIRIREQSRRGRNHISPYSKGASWSDPTHGFLWTSRQDPHGKRKNVRRLPPTCSYHLPLNLSLQGRRGPRRPDILPYNLYN